MCSGERDYECAPCPANATSGANSIGVDACLCQPNFFDATKFSGVTCEACPLHSTSVEGSVDLRHVCVRRGTLTRNQTPLMIHTSPVSAARCVRSTHTAHPSPPAGLMRSMQRLALRRVGKPTTPVPPAQPTPVATLGARLSPTVPATPGSLMLKCCPVWLSVNPARHCRSVHRIRC